MNTNEVLMLLLASVHIICISNVRIYPFFKVKTKTWEWKSSDVTFLGLLLLQN